MKNYYVAFDIETESLPREHVLSFSKPFKVFEPSKIKTGDCKTDEAKACKIACAKSAHDAEEREYLDNAASRGALNPDTGRVLSIGFRDAIQHQLLLPHLIDPTEKADPDKVEWHMLAAFWARWEGFRDSGMLLSWNGAGFDLPFLVRRSWILKVPIPHWVRRGRWWDDSHVDLMRLWNNYDPNAYTKLDHAARVLGLGSKSDQEVSGGSFAPFYREGGAKRELAIRYAIKDLELTAALGERMLGL